MLASRLPNTCVDAAILFHHQNHNRVITSIFERPGRRHVAGGGCRTCEACLGAQAELVNDSLAYAAAPGPACYSVYSLSNSRYSRCTLQPNGWLAGCLKRIAIASPDPHTQTCLSGLRSCAMQYKDRERHLVTGRCNVSSNAHYDCNASESESTLRTNLGRPTRSTTVNFPQ
jgi:hypothetical protein